MRQPHLVCIGSKLPGRRIPLGSIRVGWLFPRRVTHQWEGGGNLVGSIHFQSLYGLKGNTGCLA